MKIIHEEIIYSGYSNYASTVDAIKIMKKFVNHRTSKLIAGCTSLSRSYGGLALPFLINQGKGSYQDIPTAGDPCSSASR